MYTALVQQFKDAQAKAAAAYLEVRAAETALFPRDGQYSYCAAETRSEYKTERELSDFCNRLSHVLVREAVRRFSPPGGRLEIEDSRELANASIDIHEALRAGKCPDFDAFWAHLERTYSGDAGKRIGLMQAAKSIIDGFNIRPNSEIKRTSSAIVLEGRIWSEPCYRSSARKATYHSQQTVVNITRGLAAFAGHAGFDVLASELKHGRLLDYQFETREKVCFNGLDIVMYNDGSSSSRIRWAMRFRFSSANSVPTTWPRVIATDRGLIMSRHRVYLFSRYVARTYPLSIDDLLNIVRAVECYSPMFRAAALRHVVQRAPLDVTGAQP